MPRDLNNFLMPLQTYYVKARDTWYYMEFWGEGPPLVRFSEPEVFDPSVLQHPMTEIRAWFEWVPIEDNQLDGLVPIYSVPVGSSWKMCVHVYVQPPLI